MSVEHDGGELIFRNGLAARGLAQMARQVGQADRELQVLRDAQVMQVEAGLAESLFYGTGRAFPFRATYAPAMHVGAEAKRATHLVRRGVTQEY